MSSKRFLLCLLCVTAFGSALSLTSVETNETSAEGNETSAPVQVNASMVPEFPVVEPVKKLSVEGKVKLAKKAIQEVINAKNMLRKHFAEAADQERNDYQEKLDVVKEYFQTFKSKMDKVRFTKEIEDAVKNIKVMRADLNETKQRQKTAEEDKNKVVVSSARGKKDCQDLAVTDPGDNAFPHAVLKQEVDLINTLRAYLTKLAHGNKVHDMESNRLSALLEYNSVYDGLLHGKRNEKIENGILKELGLSRSDFTFTDFRHDTLKKNVDLSAPTRHGLSVKRAIAILGRADKLTRQTGKLYTLPEDNTIIQKCFKRWNAVVGLARKKNAEIAEEINEKEDSLNAMIVDLAQKRKKRDLNVEVSVFLPAYHNALWESGERSKVITDAYAFVMQQHEWSFKKSMGVLNRQLEALNERMTDLVRERDADAGVAETCLTEKSPLGQMTGGPSDPTNEWNVECDSGLVMKGLWVSESGDKNVEDMKCCKLPEGSYVNANKCKAESIEKTDKDARCSEGVAVGFHALTRTRAPEILKCCDIFGDLEVDTEQCMRIPLGGSKAAGGTARSNLVWRGECLHNTVLTGFYLNENRDIDGASCCATKKKEQRPKKSLK